jgi:hypothetical protein
MVMLLTASTSESVLVAIKSKSSFVASESVFVASESCISWMVVSICAKSEVDTPSNKLQNA